jgi:hypothetical protein
MYVRLFPVVASVALAGCIPAPVEKSPPVVGHISDARTHRPVAAAQVSLPESDVSGTTTDAQGWFSLARQNKLGLVVLLPFDPAYRTVPLEVRHEGYKVFRTAVPFYVYTEPKPMDILLEPSR